MALQLTSTAFPEGATIPKQYTADGRNLSPPLRWTDAPAGAKSFALVCEDRDLVLVPEGYHPVAAAAGYDCYYLNAQAGPTRAWLVTDDPAHRWIKTRAARPG